MVRLRSSWVFQARSGDAFSAEQHFGDDPIRSAIQVPIERAQRQGQSFASLRRKLTKGGCWGAAGDSAPHRREACTRIFEASGFTQQYISDLERGRRNPTVVTLFELASTLGLSHVDLVLPDEEFCKEQTKTPKQK